MRNFQEHLFKRTSASGFFYFCTCFQIYFRYSSFLCSSFLFVAAGELVILAFWLIIKYFKDLPRGIVRGLSYVWETWNLVLSEAAEAAFRGCFLEKMFWKYAANLQENTHAEVWFQHTSAWLFSCEFVAYFQNTF